jgi:hypothetical protein
LQLAVETLQEWLDLERDNAYTSSTCLLFWVWTHKLPARKLPAEVPQTLDPKKILKMG